GVFTTAHYLVKIGTSTNDFNQQYNVTTYPNPTQGVVNIRFDLVQNQDVQIALYNSVGQLVEVFADTNLTAGTHRQQMNLTAYPKGVYLAQITVDGKSSMQQIVLH
ncbi:MAG: T9SS type A sorting domain-containing protein, partial [Chitinophagales bacterium]